MRIFDRVLKGFSRKQLASRKPSFSDVLKTGRAMGLDEKDLAAIYKGGAASRIKGFVSIHWFYFVLAACVAWGILLFAISNSPPPAAAYPTPNYPAGARYGAICMKDFERKAQR